jgi:hypothetical protein
MFHQQVFDEEGTLVVFGFLVDPEFLLRYVRITVMLAKIRELLINMPAEVCAIDNPNLKVPARFVPL